MAGERKSDLKGNAIEITQCEEQKWNNEIYIYVYIYIVNNE